MTRPECPRLEQHVAGLTRMYTHLDEETIARVRRDHCCPDCPGGWRPTPHLPRDPEQPAPPMAHPPSRPTPHEAYPPTALPPITPYRVSPPTPQVPYPPSPPTPYDPVPPNGVTPQDPQPPNGPHPLTTPTPEAGPTLRPAPKPVLSWAAAQDRGLPIARAAVVDNSAPAPRPARCVPVAPGVCIRDASVTGRCCQLPADDDTSEDEQ